MLDVHAPEHSISGVREFFIHLFTITVGLLIALGLENATEAMHHRHQRKEAEAMIRQELAENRSDLLKSQETMQSEMKDLVMVLGFIDAKLKHQAFDSKLLKLSYSQSPMKDAAWRTAAATGVAQYMDYETVEKFSECYKEQDELERAEERTLEGYLNMEAFVATRKPQDLSDDELRAAQPIVRKTLADLGGMRDIARGTLATYDQALK